MFKIAEFEGFYDWQRSHLSEPEFVLHDGPPYANGKLHMGHAINKVRSTYLFINSINKEICKYQKSYLCYCIA